MPWFVTPALRWVSSVHGRVHAIFNVQLLSYFIGLAIGLSQTPEHLRTDVKGLMVPILRLVLGVSLGIVSTFIHKTLIPKENIALFYVSEYFLNACFVICILCLVPAAGSAKVKGGKVVNKKKRS